nr:MAG TPA: hypothetical protein [Caudoviricetes sp.]
MSCITAPHVGAFLLPIGLRFAWTDKECRPGHFDMVAGAYILTFAKPSQSDL